jgi:hypothetical protein
MRQAAVWVNHHDAAKLWVIALGAILVILSAIGASGSELFFLAVFVGVALAGAGAFWLGNWKWIFIPLVAMLAEIVCAVPLSLGDPEALETPLSIILEAPFWTGIPALVGAALGYGVSRARV